MTRKQAIGAFTLVFTVITGLLFGPAHHPKLTASLLRASVVLDDSHPIFFTGWQETANTSNYNKSGDPCWQQPVPDPPNSSLVCTGTLPGLICGGWTVNITSTNVVTATTHYGGACTYEVQGLATNPSRLTRHAKKHFQAIQRAAKKRTLEESREYRALPDALAAACPPGRCAGKSIPKPKLTASQSTPNIPASWTVPTWYIDPANLTICASDTNSGTASTCTGGCTGSTCPSGIGPIVTWAELAQQRWGTYSPRIQQNTTINILSSMTSRTDVIYLSNKCEENRWVNIQGPINSTTQIATGTLSGVTSKNRASAQLLEATFPSGVTQDAFVVNSTHASGAWTYKQVTGNEYEVSQPLTRAATPWTFTELVPSEVDTWANGDTVTLYAPVKLNIDYVTPAYGDISGTGNNACVYLTDVEPHSYGSADQSYITFGQGVALNEVFLDRVVDINDPGAPLDYPIQALNTDSSIGYGGTAFGELGIIAGGMCGNFGGGGTLDGFAGWGFDYDVIFGTTTGGSSYSMHEGETADADIGYVYIDSTSELLFWGWNQVSSIFDLGVQGIWGPGYIGLQQNSTLLYPTGAGSAAATFLQTGGFYANGQTHMCLGIPSSATLSTTCDITFSASNLDSNLGTTSGCLYVPGGSGVCNFTE